MKVTTVTFERLYNTGKFENEKYSITAEVEEGDSPVDALAQLRGAVSQAKEADEIPWGEAEQPKPKAGKKPAGKKAKDEEEDEEETEEEEDLEDEEEESNEEEDSEEEDEEEKKPVKGKKTFKKKGSTYSRTNDVHKKLFVEAMNEELGDGWVKKNAGRAKTVSIKMEGKDFLDAEGQVVDTFKATMKKLAKQK